jgi:hypothetical protein
LLPSERPPLALDRWEEFGLQRRKVFDESASKGAVLTQFFDDAFPFHPLLPLRLTSSSISVDFLPTCLTPTTTPSLPCSCHRHYQLFHPRLRLPQSRPPLTARHVTIPRPHRHLRRLSPCRHVALPRPPLHPSHRLPLSLTDLALLERIPPFHLESTASQHPSAPTRSKRVEASPRGVQAQRHGICLG